MPTGLTRAVAATAGIGCKQCVWCASATFRIEPEHGRSRVYAQWLDDEEKIQTAIGRWQPGGKDEAVA